MDAKQQPCRFGVSWPAALLPRAPHRRLLTALKSHVVLTTRNFRGGRLSPDGDTCSLRQIGPRPQDAVSRTFDRRMRSVGHSTATVTLRSLLLEVIPTWSTIVSDLAYWG